MRSATGKALQENVGRAASTLMRVIYVRDQQVKRLNLRGHTGTIAEMGEHVPQGMMPPCAIPAAVAQQSVITLDVHYGTAEWA